MIGFDARIFFSICVSESDPLMVAKYLMAYLADTVFPAPDSPETIILWSLFSLEKITFIIPQKKIMSHFFLNTPGFVCMFCFSCMLLMFFFYNNLSSSYNLNLSSVVTITWHR